MYGGAERRFEDSGTAAFGDEFREREVVGDIEFTVEELEHAIETAVGGMNRIGG